MFGIVGCRLCKRHVSCRFVQVLSENVLRSGGAESICSMLMENMTIQTLDLSGMFNMVLDH